MQWSGDEGFQRGLAALQAGKLSEAERLLQAAVRAQPKHVPALNLLGVVLGRLGQNAQAVASFDQALATSPNSTEAWYGRGMTLLAMGRLEEAITSFDRVIAGKPDFAQVHLLRAKLLADLQRHDAALAGVDRLLGLLPNSAEAWLGRSNILFELKRYDEALSAADRAVAFKSNLAEAWHARGNVFNEAKRHQEALAAYDKALALNPKFVGAWYGRGNVLKELKNYSEALAAYDKALALEPNFIMAWLGRGNLLNGLKRSDEALIAFDRAVAISNQAKGIMPKRDLAQAWFGRGNALAQSKRHDAAADAYAQALGMDRQHAFAKGAFLHQRMLCCAWEGLDELIAEIEKDILAGRLAAEPFGWQAAATTPQSLRRCAELFNAERYPAKASGAVSRPARDGRKIRIGYVSGELRDQATSHLIVGVLEHHDKSSFEIYAFDNGWNDGSEIRRRIEAAVPTIIGISQLDDQSAAAVIRDQQIDILINLNGYFGEGRTGVFAERAAPIQVNYLGFPGTLGAPYMDYIIADACVIPPGDEEFYTEKVVYLPECYQANDDRKQIAGRPFSRGECGLPAEGFVFCCFNNNYKITPEVLNSWMRVLRRVDGSVLWLLEDNVSAVSNLRKETAARGVNPERLVFAKRIPLADHLARHRLAGLFLDTLPYTAHTTASDALWAGLPVLTRIGNTFPGRVAASLLQAVGLGELITTSQKDYEELAVTLAAEPQRLISIKRKLEENRSLLFDTGLFTRRLESAYKAMHERCRAANPPSHIHVSDLQ